MFDLPGAFAFEDAAVACFYESAVGNSSALP
jgi:hypothetical protein